MTTSAEQLAQAFEPLVEAIGAAVVASDDIQDGDITIEWKGKPTIGIRLEDIVSIERLIATVETQLGANLSDLSRSDKQRAVRMLDDRGAFRLRRSIEDVGESMGVSRITIYNYLSAHKEGDK
jgi:hypothetical protein